MDAKKIQQELQDYLNNKADKKLLNQNDNKIIAAHIRNQNPDYINNRKEGAKKRRGRSWIIDLKNNDPEKYQQWLKEQTERNQNIAKDPDHGKKSTDNNLISWQDPQVRQNRLNGIHKANKDPVVIARKTQANQKKAQGEEWLKANKIQTLQTSTPMRLPFGIFPSFGEAKKYKDQHQIKGDIIYNIKKKKPGWEYITREQYVKLTGNNPWLS